MLNLESPHWGDRASLGRLGHDLGPPMSQAAWDFSARGRWPLCSLGPPPWAAQQPMCPTPPDLQTQHVRDCQASPLLCLLASAVSAIPAPSPLPPQHFPRALLHPQKNCLIETSAQPSTGWLQCIISWCCFPFTHEVGTLLCGPDFKAHVFARL